MFSTHQPIIGRYARQNPDNMARVLQFAMLSAHAPFHSMVAAMDTAERGGDGMSVKAVLPRDGEKLRRKGLRFVQLESARPRD